MEQQHEFEIEPETDEEEEFVQYDIATYPSDYTLNGLQELWQNNDIEIPDFQREFVWSIKQSSLLIESFLMGLPVPPVFFYIDEQNRSLVIDGQQRILSVIYYFSGYFGPETQHGKKIIFRLKGLAKKSPYHNKTINELHENDRRKLKTSVLRAINIKQLSPSPDNTSVFHIFERLNTGGTALRPQEIRNTVYRGPIVTKLRELNNDESWRKILGRPAPDRFQRDMELVLRSFALFEDWNNYEKPMKIFLNRSMDQNRKFSSRKAKKFESLFSKSCESILSALGERPFHIRGPLNGSVLDAVLCTVLEKNSKIPKDFKRRFEELIKEDSFKNVTRVSTTDTATVKERMKMAHKYLTQ